MEIKKVIDNGNGYFVAYHRIEGVAIYGETIKGREAAEKRLEEITTTDRHNCIEFVIRLSEAA